MSAKYFASFFTRNLRMKENSIVAVKMSGTTVNCRVLEMRKGSIKLEPVSRNSLFKGCSSVTTNIENIVKDKRKDKRKDI